MREIDDRHARTSFAWKRQARGADVQEVPIAGLDLHNRSWDWLGCLRRAGLPPHPRMMAMAKRENARLEPLHFWPRFDEVASNLGRAQRTRKSCVPMRQQQRPQTSRTRQPEHPRPGRGRNAVLPIQVTVADDRYVARLTDALHASLVVASAQIVAQKRNPPRARRAEQAKRLLERRVVAVYVRHESPHLVRNNH